MAVELGRSPAFVPGRPVALRSRLYGFGSVYAKTLRDSRLAFIVVAGMLGGIMLVAGAGITTVFNTAQSRDDIVKLATELGSMLQGLTGKPVNVGTLGGYVSWKYGPVFMFTAALWSILALSGTLATEARRGSLDFVATAPFGKRRLALEKVAAHVTVLIVATAILAVAAWLAGAAFATLPVDAIPPQAAIGYGLLVFLMALASGSVAFVLAQFVGRAAAAGIAGAILFAGYLINGYEASVPALDGPAHLTWFYWTANHIPLAGEYDWASLIPVAIVAVVLLAIGVEAFARRDLGQTTALGLPGQPAALLGLRGPVGRSLGERLPAGVGWGLGLGIFGLFIAAGSRSLADALASTSPDTLKIFQTILPNADLTSAGGALQFIFVQLGYIVAGFAAAVFVSGWVSDETSGRLEMLLATPLARRGWAVSGAVGLYLAIVVMTVILSVAVGIGAVLAGSDPLTPMAGSVVLGLYAAALAGIGVAVGGIFRPSIAAEVVALVVVVTFLIDLLAPALGLPDTVHQLALTAHLGAPMVGVWDVPGMVVCLALAVGGLLLGGWGMQHRDVGR